MESTIFPIITGNNSVVNAFPITNMNSSKKVNLYPLVVEYTYFIFSFIFPHMIVIYLHHAILSLPLLPIPQEILHRMVCLMIIFPSLHTGFYAGVDILIFHFHSIIVCSEKDTKFSYGFHIFQYRYACLLWLEAVVYRRHSCCLKLFIALSENFLYIVQAAFYGIRCPSP